MRNQRGYVLPMATVLVVVLGISGAAFLQLDFLERLMALRATGHLDAFYLANAGIERTREVCKPETTGVGNPNWTSTLAGTRPVADKYIPDPNWATNTLLCPVPARGCIIPPFQDAAGTPLTSATAQRFPFFGTFDDGSYSVRISNNAAEPGTTDLDNVITVRALGNVRGDQKVITADFVSVSGLGLLNCQGVVGSPCPSSGTTNGEMIILDDHYPASSPTLPVLSPTLTNPANYYRIPSNFNYIPHAGINLTETAITGGGTNIADNGYFYSASDVTVSGVKDNIIVFSLGQIHVSNGAILTNTILVGVGGVNFNGTTNLFAPGKLPQANSPPPSGTTINYPAIVSYGSVDLGSGNTKIYGSIYTTGTVNLNGGNVQGVVIGASVQVQGGTIYSDNLNPDYYNLMPGFSYPTDKIKATFVPSTWQES